MDVQVRVKTNTDWFVLSVYRLQVDRWKML